MIVRNANVIFVELFLGQCRLQIQTGKKGFDLDGVSGGKRVQFSLTDIFLNAGERFDH